MSSIGQAEKQKGETMVSPLRLASVPKLCRTMVGVVMMVTVMMSVRSECRSSR
ncbi:MAG TPA: hypothetical protein VGG59_06070 [Acidobacteriaceae bacterium]